MTNDTICRTLLIRSAVNAAPDGTSWCCGVIMPSTLPLCTDSFSHGRRADACYGRSSPPLKAAYGAAPRSVGSQARFRAGAGRRGHRLEERVQACVTEYTGDDDGQAGSE